MKKSWGRIFVVLSVLLALGIGVGVNVTADTTSDYDEEKAYSNEELMQMSEEELEELGLDHLVKDGFQELGEFSTASSYTPQAGDILVTKNTQCKSGSKCTGITGHSGIILNNWDVLHIQGPGYKPTRISRSQWFSKYSSTKVVRPNNSSEGFSAASWAYNFYVAGSGRNYDYDVRTGLNSFDGLTYCSKLVWQAYENGAGKNLAGYSPGFRTPYDFTGYTWWNGHSTVYTVGW